MVTQNIINFILQSYQYLSFTLPSSINFLEAYVLTFWPHKFIQIKEFCFFFRSLVFKLNIFGQFVEIGTFFQSDDQFWIDLLLVIKFDVLSWQRLNHSQSVFSQELAKLSDERNSLAHTFDLDWAVFFHDKFTKEQSLVESAVFSNSINVSFVESVGDLSHLVKLKVDVNYKSRLKEMRHLKIDFTFFWNMIFGIMN